MTDKTYSGKPCIHGHGNIRYKSNNVCIECRKRYAYVVKDWVEKNKDKKLENGKKWYSENKERKREKQKEWNKQNPDRLKIHHQNRKSRVGEQKISYQDVQKIFAFQKGCCAICKTSLDSYEIDHVMPLFLGGKHDSSNIQILCRHCNRTKNAKDPIEFMQSKGYLL